MMLVCLLFLSLQMDPVPGNPKRLTPSLWTPLPGRVHVLLHGLVHGLPPTDPLYGPPHKETKKG